MEFGTVKNVTEIVCSVLNINIFSCKIVDIDNICIIYGRIAFFDTALPCHYNGYVVNLSTKGRVSALPSFDIRKSLKIL